MENKTLIINGVRQPLVVSPDTTLAQVIRKQVGLTGTKVGCGIGQCGVCSVILNGKVVRSCV